MNNLIKHSAFAILLALHWPTHGIGQQAPTLPKLAAMAIGRNHDLANSNLDIAMDRETQKGIREAYLPRVEAGGRYAYLNNDLTIDIPTGNAPILNIPVFDGRSTFSTSANFWTADVNASMLLFSGTQVPKLNRAIAHKIEAQEHLLEQRRQEIVNEVSVAYDQLALLKQVQVVLDESEKRLSIEKEIAEKAFKYGLITSYELSKVEVAQATLEAKRQEYEGKQGLLLKQLNQLTAMPVESLALINDELKVYSIDLQNGGIGNRPEIAALDAAIKANQYKLSAAETYWLPKAQAVAGVRYYGLSNSIIKTPYTNPINGQAVNLGPNTFEAFPSYFVGVGFKWNIFDGLQGKRDVKKAKMEVLKSENKRQQADELLQLNLERAQTEYRIANKHVEASAKRREAAQRALQIAQKEYKVGLIKPADRIGAENDYQQAALDYLQSVFNQRRSAMDCLKAIGELTIDKL